MSQIQVPDSLIRQIEAAGLTGVAVDEFVQQAVREKLAGRLPGSQISQVLNEFDALCDEIAVSAPGTHLTRDQLHERR
jgi:hypothetical protein